MLRQRGDAQLDTLPAAGFSAADAGLGPDSSACAMELSAPRERAAARAQRAPGPCGAVRQRRGASRAAATSSLRLCASTPQRVRLDDSPPHPALRPRPETPSRAAVYTETRVCGFSPGPSSGLSGARNGFRRLPRRCPLPEGLKVHGRKQFDGSERSLCARMDRRKPPAHEGVRILRQPAAFRLWASNRSPLHAASRRVNGRLAFCVRKPCSGEIPGHSRAGIQSPRELANGKRGRVVPLCCVAQSGVWDGYSSSQAHLPTEIAAPGGSPSRSDRAMELRWDSVSVEVAGAGGRARQ